MINVSPVGRNASTQERNEYEKYDKQHNIRPKFVETLKKEFGDFGLTFVALSLSSTSFLPPPLFNIPEQPLSDILFSKGTP